MSDGVLIKIEDVSRIFPVAGGEFAALKNINAVINKGPAGYYQHDFHNNQNSRKNHS